MGERTGHPLFRLAIGGLTILLAMSPHALSQRGPSLQRNPHIGYVYPAGAQLGTDVEITVGGQYLRGVSEAVFSGEGLEATVLKHHQPLSPKQRNEIREIVDAARKRLQEKRKQGKYRGRAGDLNAVIELAQEMGADRDLLEAFARFRRQQMDPKRQPNPQLSEDVVLRVRVASDVAPGEHELRLLADAGLSNPLRFCVGPWPEQRETEPNDKTDDAGKSVSLPAVFNGQMMPGDVDHFAFTARQGQRVVISVKARRLIPYLADAVPGWFQATLALQDADGNEVAYVDDYGFRPDPVLYCVIPRSGRYVLQVKDAIYRGREDFVYRVTVGSLPFVRSIFPLGGRADAATTVQLLGWNLRTDTLTVPPQHGHSGVYSLPLPEPQRTYNPIPFAVDTLQESFEEEPNDAIDSAQLINPPLVVNGRIHRPGDQDVFRFHGRSSDPLVVEVLARRVDSPLDSIIKLTDADGRSLIVNDDHLDQGAGLTTHHADSQFRFALPEAGDYYVHLADSQFKGGDDYVYRLRVSTERPDFELRVVPSTINATAGATLPISVHALRRDGFSGTIMLALKDAPPGFSLSGGWIPAHQDKTWLTLTVPTRPENEPIRLHLEGRAVIGGDEICREAIPADEMMQAFIYRHLVPAREWCVFVARRGGRRPRLTLVGERPVKLPAGGTTRVEMNSNQKLPADQLKFSLSHPSDGITLDDATVSGKKLAIQLRADPNDSRPGLQGNVLIDLMLARAVGQQNAKPGNLRRNVPLGTLPAIPFEIVSAEGQAASDATAPVE